MRISRFRIPRTVRLPGIVIAVHELPDTEMTHDGELCDGYFNYSIEDGTSWIDIRKNLPITKKRYVLIHEIQHAIVDLLDIGLSRFPHIIGRT